MPQLKGNEPILGLNIQLPNVKGGINHQPPRGRYNPPISRESLTLHHFPFLPPKNI
jgi:hypothetical protein